MPKSRAGKGRAGLEGYQPLSRKKIKAFWKAVDRAASKADKAARTAVIALSSRKG